MAAQNVSRAAEEHTVEFVRDGVSDVERPESGPFVRDHARMTSPKAESNCGAEGGWRQVGWLRRADDRPVGATVPRLHKSLVRPEAQPC